MNVKHDVAVNEWALFFQVLSGCLVIYSFMPTCTDYILNKLLTKEDSSVVTAAKLVKLLGKLLKQSTKRLVGNTSWVESCTKNL